MKQKELTQEEKQAINGGNSVSGSTEANVGTDSLLSLNTTSTNGDRSSSHNLEVGKGLEIDLGANLDRLTGN